MTVIAIDPETGEPLPPQQEGPVVAASSSEPSPSRVDEQWLVHVGNALDELDSRLHVLERADPGEPPAPETREILEAARTAFEEMSKRIQTIEDKVANIIERIEGLESLDDAAKAAASHKRRG